MKGALFLCAGILLHRFETVDISHLRGRGHALPFTGAIFAIAGLGLAGLPPFGTFLGKGQIEDAVTAAGYGWVTVVLVLASMATGGAVLRAGAEVFLGWGWPAEDPAAANEGDERESESGGPSGRTPPVLFAPALVLVVAGLLVGVLPRPGPGNRGRGGALRGSAGLHRRGPPRRDPCGAPCGRAWSWRRGGRVSHR